MCNFMLPPFRRLAGCLARNIHGKQKARTRLPAQRACPLLSSIQKLLADARGGCQGIILSAAHTVVAWHHSLALPAHAPAPPTRPKSSPTRRRRCRRRWPLLQVLLPARGLGPAAAAPRPGPGPAPSWPLKARAAGPGAAGWRARALPLPAPAAPPPSPCRGQRLPRQRAAQVTRVTERG
jgi:hypothetical protein